jgi:hypothetical protein
MGHMGRVHVDKRLSWCNIVIDLKEMVSVGMDWINLSQERDN